jgi:CRISPR/Cas system CMR-associated protein Cmr3 (group 5 of RAMP superfamily)
MEKLSNFKKLKETEFLNKKFYRNVANKDLRRLYMLTECCLLMSGIISKIKTMIFKEKKIEEY